MTTLKSRRRRLRTVARRLQQNQRVTSRRLGLESLEPRQMLSATPQFQVLNDATTNLAFRYSEAGAAQGSYSLVAANAAPRGAASTVGVEQTWVIDANRNVYIYSTSGGLLGSWSAGSMPNKATPEGIATDGTNIWIVDSKSDKVYFYADAANRLAGSQNADSSFSLNSSNTSPKGLVSDGASLWIINDTAKTDKVFKYAVNGSLLGSWTIDSANKTPTGITLDPANVGDIWIVDSGTDRVYRYTAAAGRNSGSQSASASFALASGNGNPQGLVMPGRSWSETPYQVEWVRQFGSTGDDWVRGVTADGFGNVYLSGGTTGPMVGPNANGLQAPYLAQYDTNGSLNWIQQGASVAGVEYGGVRVVTDSQGNLLQVVNVVSGSFASSLRSYDPAGALRWETYLPVGEGMFDVTVDGLGFAYASSYEGNNVHVRKFDGATGSIIWQVELNTGGFTNTSGISADQMGNVYVTAYTSGALLGPNAGSYDALVIKISESGTILWSRQYGSAGTDYAFYAGADAFGNVYSGGRTDGSLGGPTAGGVDFFLAKHDSAGNLLWTRQYGTSGEDTQADLWVDPQGNVFRAISTTASYGGAYLGGIDIVVAKYDPQGNILWATQVGTAGDDQPWGGIWGDDQGNVYVTGRTTGSWGGTNAGGGDAFVIKLSSPATAASSSTLATSAALKVSANSLSSNTIDMIGVPTSLDTATPVGHTNGRCQSKSLTSGAPNVIVRNGLMAFLQATTHNAQHLYSGWVDHLLASWESKVVADIGDLPGLSSGDNHSAAELALDAAFASVL